MPLDWEPGNDGKGIIDQEGHVHTWNGDEYDSHADYIRSHDIPSASAFFVIAPNGHVESGNLDVLDPEALDLINEHDPRLYHKAHGIDTWHLGWTIGTEDDPDTWVDVGMQAC